MHVAALGGLRGTGEETQEVFDAASSYVHGEGHGFSMAAGLALDVALRENGGASEVRFDAAEMRVSVGAVDYGLIGGRQVNHVGTAGDFEIGDVDGAFAIDVAD